MRTQLAVLVALVLLLALGALQQPAEERGGAAMLITIPHLRISR